MPPFGTVLPDHAAIDVVSRWVREELSTAIVGQEGQ
jgi:hypothetical protein